MIAVKPMPTRRRRPDGRPEPLENGERMLAPEFLRRYEAMPSVRKAELIESVVYMGSPVRIRVHAKPDNLVQTWLGTYAIETPGVEAATNGTVRLDIENVPQPDAILRIVEECGGASSLDDEGYLAGPPELAVEIAASSAGIDLHQKLRAYQRSGIKEYLVWRTKEKGLDWFVLVEGVYECQAPDRKGLCHSRSFPGLVLDVPAMLVEDGAAVLATLRTALRSPAHRNFVSTLAARNTGATGNLRERQRGRI